MKYTDIDFNDKSILITGGAGFIGSNLAFYFQNNYPSSKIVIFDAFRSDAKFPSGNFSSLGHFKNLNGFKGEVISGDINYSDDLNRLNNYKFDYIFHQAAISDTTVMNQKLVVQTNTNAFKDILDISVRDSANIVYASSAGTYGNSAAPNCVGSGEIPENVYGFSKLMMDNIAKSYMQKHTNISIVGLRYFNVYGAREVHKAKTASMMLQLSTQLLSGNVPRLFKYGEQKRDFVYIEDVIQANVRSASAKNSGVFNVGSGKARTFNDVVNILQKELGTSQEIEYFDNPYSFYQNHTEADITLSKEVLGYSPNFELEDGIAAYKDELIEIYNNKQN